MFTKGCIVPEISGFHAHVYFDEATLDQATELCKAAEERFSLVMGRIHQKPVGPHPMWSCQLACGPETFGELVPWLAVNRNGLIIFIHPVTDNDLKDHTDHAIWMGEVRELDLSIFA